MSKIAKILLVTTVAFAMIVMGSGVLLAASVVRSGVVKVKVHESGTDGMNIYVPAALVGIGLDVLPLVMEKDMWTEMRTDLGDWAPAAAAALQAVEDAPDAVLVDVHNDHESVQIVKEGRSLEIHVKDASGTVEISLPAGLLGRIAREIA